ncbi:hypothetical protein J6590_009068 [Homalodisca vitripennis]|nr:hypothetical protein J6590_009068 [Homalodisca vitripennis]
MKLYYPETHHTQQASSQAPSYVMSFGRNSHTASGHPAPEEGKLKSRDGTVGGGSEVHGSWSDSLLKERLGYLQGVWCRVL